MADEANEDTPFLLTHTQEDGEYSRHLNYFLANGARRRVTIDAAHDSEDLRHKIGLALHNKHVKGQS